MILSPKEKAKDLVEHCAEIIEPIEYGVILERNWKSAKQCALIAVDEIIKSDPINPNDVDWDDAGGTHLYYHLAQKEEALEFWKQVKEEILKL